MWCHAGWIKGKQPLNFNAPDWSSEERRTTPPFAAGVDVVEGIAIKKCTIISLFSRTAGGRTWSQKAMKNNGCQSYCPVTKHIPQTHSTNTFHAFHTFHKHIPRNSHKNNRDPHEQEWHLPLCLCFVLLYMVLFKTKLPVGALLIEAGDCPAGCHLRCLLLFVGD